MERVRKSIPLWLLVGLLFIFWLFSYGPLQPVPKPVEEYGLWAHNMYNEFLPDYDYAFRRLKSGQLPLWNPFQTSGLPSLAALQAGVFYPPNVLFLVTSTEAAIGYSTLFHLCFAALFTYLFFRSIFPEAHVLGACVAALGFVFNPRMYEFVLFPGNFMTACWLPAVAFFAQRMVVKRTRRSCVLLGLSVGMPFLAGFAPAAVYIYQFLVLFLLYRIGWMAFVERQRHEAVRVFGLCLLAAAAALLLFSPQVLPTYELTRLSARSLGTMTPEMSQVYGPEPYSFSTWLSGVLFYPKAMELVDGRHPIPPWTIFMLLATLGAVRKKNISSSAFLLAVAAGFFVVSLGTNTPIYRLYWDHVPTGNWFTTPIRLRVVSYFCLAVVAGYGMDLLADRDAPEWRARAGLLLRLGIIVVASAAMVGACLILLRGPALLTYSAMGIHLVLLIGLCITAWGGQKFLQRLFLTMVIGLIVLESFVWYANKVPFPAKVNPKQTLYSQAVAQALKSLDGGWRTHIENGWGLTFFGLPTVPEKFGSLFLIPVTTNWEPLTPRIYQEYCNNLTGRRFYYGRFQIAGRPFDKKMFDMLSARYIVFSDAGKDWISARLRTEQGKERYRLVKDLGPQKIYENTQALERVNFASKWEVMNSPDELFRRMHEQSFDPRTTVLLLEAPPGPALTEGAVDASAPAKDAILSFDAGFENVEIEVDAPSPGIVWISDCYYPGWKVFVDGVEREVLRVNYTFRGVQVDSGRHKIEMMFQPGSFRLGRLFGGLGLLLAIFLVVWPERRPDPGKLKRYQRDTERQNVQEQP